jgi:hypothetical protein
MSLSILARLVFQFSFAILVGLIPTILICVGCWMNYANGQSGQLHTTGFTCISVALIIELVVLCLCTVIIVFACLVAGIVLLNDYWFHKLGYVFLALAFVSAVVAVLMFPYFLGLRKSAVSARGMVGGRPGPMQVSLFPVVLLCIQGVLQLLSLLLRTMLAQAIQQLLNYIGYFSSFSVQYGLNAFINSGSLSILYSGWSAVALTLVSVGVTVCSIVLLIQARTKKIY